MCSQFLCYVLRSAYARNVVYVTRFQWNQKTISIKRRYTEDSVFLGCDTMSFHNRFPTYRKKIFLWKLGNRLSESTASYPRTTESSIVLPWKLQDSQKYGCPYVKSCVIFIYHMSWQVGHNCLPVIQNTRYMRYVGMLVRVFLSPYPFWPSASSCICPHQTVRELLHEFLWNFT